MTDKNKSKFGAAREKFLGFSLESSRKSYYPQLIEKLEEAKNNEQRLQLLIDNLPARISYVNAQEKYVLVNSEYEKAFKTNKEAIIGSSIKDVLGLENYQVIKPYITQALAGKKVRFETSILVPNEETQWNDISYLPIVGQSGEVDGFYVLVLDLTENKRSEEEKRNLETKLYETQKFKAIGTLAGGVAHDFNNLLMGIQGHSALMRMELDPSSPLLEHVKAIDEQIKSAASLTRQMLGLSRGGKYEIKPTDINTLIRNQAQLFGRTRKEISIHYELEEQSFVVEADQNQIEQVLLNLFINASEAMPDGGDLHLVTKTVYFERNECLAYDVYPGSYVGISVTDNGTGMPGEVRQRVFDPFFTTKEKQRGTGLGLASAYGIVKNHGGIIKVYSELEQGSTFSIFLPLSRRSAQKSKPSKPKLLKGDATICLIDDESVILDVGRAMLERLGYTVFTFESGQDAIKSISENRHGIDLVILDMIMPGMDGGRTFDHIRNIDSSLPVILASGYTRNAQAEHIIQRGCQGFLQKPFSLHELSLKVAEVLQNT